MVGDEVREELGAQSGSTMRYKPRTRLGLFLRVMGSHWRGPNRGATSSEVYFKGLHKPVC